ncbi:apotyrosinase chaperone MelC1 [Kitasatospora indigofera]|uniref:apotyrosinase chaperone MelC1 n=1 Tax=Kitasatospora indigofera TaxID=67307 RepID=UPI0033BAEB63
MITSAYPVGQPFADPPSEAFATFAVAIEAGAISIKTVAIPRGILMPENSTELTRRRMLQSAGFALTAASAFAVIGLTGPGAAPADAAVTAGTDPETDFDESYLGRRIQSRPATGHQHQHHSSHAILIDGQALHAMQNADGTWVSVIHHYQTYRTPRALARAAVTKLQGATLLPLN